MAKTKAQLRTENSNNFPNNNSQFITPEKLRGFNNDIIDSLVVSSDTGSYVTTSSFDNGTRDLTFTKADGSTYTNNIPGGGGGSTDTGSLLTTASVSDATITFTKGDASTFGITVNNVVSSSYAVTSSHALNGGVTSIIAGTNVLIDQSQGDVTISTTQHTQTGSLLTTASNDFSEITFTKGDGSTFLIDSTPRKVIESVINKNGFMAKGTPVYVSGSTGNALHVYAASASRADRMPATFVLNQDLNTDEEGYGILNGFINGVNTSTFGEGDNVYVGANGGYTNTKPTGSGILVQKLGNVVKAEVNGSGVISGAGRSNDLPNIQEGYIWVGDSNGVPESIPSSSLSTGSFAIPSNERLKIAGGTLATGVGSIGFYSSSNFDPAYGWLNIQPEPGGGGRVAIAWFPDNHHLMFFDPNSDRVEFEAAIKSNGNNPLSVATNLQVTGSIHSNGIGIFSGSSQVDVTQTTNIATIATTGSNTFTADQNVTGRVKQTLDAPADYTQEDFIIINSASVVGNSYPITQFTIQDYTSLAGTDYTDSFVFEYWSSGYGYGSEISINGIHTKLETSPSGSGFTQRATLRTQDNQDGTSTAQIEGNTILLGNASRSSLIKSATEISSSNAISASFFIGDGSKLQNLPAAGGIFEQTGSFYATTNDLQITGSLGVSKAIGGKNSDLTITSNTASIDLTTSNTFTVTLVSSADTHLDVSTFGEDAQSVNLLVKQPTSGNTGSISFSPDFKFGQGYSFVPTAATSSEDIVSFTRFGNYLYGTYINNFS